MNTPGRRGEIVTGSQAAKMTFRNAFKEFFRGAVAELPAGPAVEFVRGRKDIFITILLKGTPLGKMVRSRPLCRSFCGLSHEVGVSEEHLCAPFLNLGKIGKLAPVVHGNGLEDLGEVVPKVGPDGPHGLHNGLAGLDADMVGMVVLRLLLQQGEDDSLLAVALSNNRVPLPMAFLSTEGSRREEVWNVLAKQPLVFMGPELRGLARKASGNSVTFRGMRLAHTQL